MNDYAAVTRSGGSSGKEEKSVFSTMTKKEYQRAKEAYAASPGIGRRDVKRMEHILLTVLGVNLPFDCDLGELMDTLFPAKPDPQHLNTIEDLNLDEFLLILDNIKQQQTKRDADKDSALVEAFVALGGNSDKSGEILVRELKLTIQDFNLQVDIERLLSEIDLDNDGTVDYLEFSALLMKSGDRDKEIFEKLGGNIGGGQISCDVLKRNLDLFMVGYGVPQTVVERIVDQADENTNGHIEFKEFKEHIIRKIEAVIRKKKFQSGRARKRHRHRRHRHQHGNREPHSRTTSPSADLEGDTSLVDEDRSTTSPFRVAAKMNSAAPNRDMERARQHLSSSLKTDLHFGDHEDEAGLEGIDAKEMENLLEEDQTTPPPPTLQQQVEAEQAKQLKTSSLKKEYKRIMDHHLQRQYVPRGNRKARRDSMAQRSAARRKVELPPVSAGTADGEAAQKRRPPSRESDSTTTTTTWKAVSQSATDSKAPSGGGRPSPSPRPPSYQPSPRARMRMSAAQTPPLRSPRKEPRRIPEPPGTRVRPGQHTYIDQEKIQSLVQRLLQSPQLASPSGEHREERGEYSTQLTQGETSQGGSPSVVPVRTANHDSIACDAPFHAPTPPDAPYVNVTIQRRQSPRHQHPLTSQSQSFSATAPLPRRRSPETARLHKGWANMSGSRPPATVPRNQSAIAPPRHITIAPETVSSNAGTGPILFSL